MTKNKVWSLGKKIMIEKKNNPIKKRILTTARKYFFTQGYSKATMDELATELHMSKKTLYQFFNSKQFLLESVIYDFFQDFHNKINKIIRTKKNRRIGVLKQFMSLVQAQISQFNIWAFEDIRKNNPRAWLIINQLEEKLINSELRKLLQEGKKEGTVCQDIDLDLIVLMILNTIKSVVIPEVVSQLSYSTEEVIDMLARIVMHGISSPGNAIDL
ncbi:MAG: TetR/AcrR family transcriptional regulator [Atribacterota bacterium]|jgi:AcrR family transcriptional regulator|nr:TetR/AcrR family transcriptional regulator [Atribacterota bacterium]MDD4895552.1 TetR/AcrR family transcriptional regulator [Atribacterota bacterium]MDD5637152.1 TetR/AcrR family transcriptional regulator [Atribacterota bacterium]